MSDITVTGLERCERCGCCNCDDDLFGFNKDGVWSWFCSKCRPTKFWADKRLPGLGSPTAKPDGDR
jgi:hypothetical protein